MVRNKFLMALLAIMLVFGMAVIGCDTGSGDPNEGPGGSGTGTGGGGGGGGGSDIGTGGGGGGGDPTPSAKYIITGSGSSFTAKKNNVNVSGAVDMPISSVISAIRTDASGASCEIQFGNGTDVLDIGTSNISFYSTWTVTLSGKLTSALSGEVLFISSTASNVNLICKADITNTYTAGSFPEVIDIGSTSSTITIESGTISVSSNTGYTIRSKGTVIVNGGTVLSAGRDTIYNDGGTVTINGGTVEGSGILSFGAISNQAGGTLTITNGTIKTTTTGDDITAIYNKGTATINGGTVSPMIANETGGTMTINSGTISSPSYCAIFNYGNVVTITGGTISSATTTRYGTIYTGAGATTNITGGTITAPSGGYAIYNASPPVYNPNNLPKGNTTISGTAVITGDRYGM